MRRYTVHFTETITREAEIEIEVTDHQDHREAETVARTRMGELVWSEPVKTVKASGWRAS